MKKTRSDWVAVHWAWYRDEVIEAIADQEPLVIALWPVLVAQAQEKSCVDRNPDGLISTTIKKLAASSRVPASKVEAILALLTEGETIEVAKGKLGTMQIRLINYGEWNRPRGSSARRQQESRLKKDLQGKSAPIVTTGSQNVTASSQDVTGKSQNVTTQHDPTQPDPTRPNPSSIDDPRQVVTLDAESLSEWRRQVREELSRFVADDQLDYVTDRVEWKAKASRFRADQWVWAVRITADRVLGGMELSGDAMGYIVSVVPGAGPPVGARPEVVGSARPEVVEALRREAEFADLAAKYGGGAA